MFGMFHALILFADDLCLLTPTRSALEQMIQQCSNYCTKFGLSFNVKQSKIMLFPKDPIAYEDLEPVLLNGGIINYVSSIKYTLVLRSLITKVLLFPLLMTYPRSIVLQTRSLELQRSQVMRFFYNYFIQTVYPFWHTVVLSKSILEDKCRIAIRQ